MFSKASGDFKMDAKLDRLSSSYQDLRALLPNVLGNSLPSSLDYLKNFTIRGTTQITPQEIDADVDIVSELGLISSNLKMTNIKNIDDASYKGNIIFDDFDLGTFANDKNIGNISFNLDVDGKGFNLEKLNSNVKGTIFGLDFKTYYYSDVVVSGRVKNKIFDGQLATEDNNVDFEFDGLVDFSKDINQYDFKANVKRANLKALNFVTNDSISHFQGIVEMDMKGTNYDDAFGNISFKNTLYKNENDEYYFKDFAISSRFENQVRHIDINSPDIIEGSLHGNFKVAETKKLIENALGNIYTNYNAHEVEQNQFIDFNFRIYSKIVEVFYPEINFGPNTYIRGRVESDAKNFRLTFKSPQIKYGNDFANNIQLKIDNKNPLFNTYVEVENIESKAYNVSNFSLINVTLKDTLFIKTAFKGGKEYNDNFDLNLYYTINEEDKSVFGFKKSEVAFKNNKWFINNQRDLKNKIIFDRLFKSVIIDNIAMNHADEKIELVGELRDSTYKNINLDFKNVDLKKITPNIDSLALAGNVNGKLNIKQQNNIYLPESNVTIDDFSINNFNLGSFKANIKGNESLTNYKVDVRLKDDTNESLAVTGDLDVSGVNSTMDLDIAFKDFILEPLNPFGEGVITEIRGNIDGNAKVFGAIKRPDIIGLLALNQGGLAIPYLNVNYQFDDNTKIALQEQSFIFNKAKMFDVDFNSSAELSGKINHVNLSNWSLGLDIDSERFLVLNTQDSEDALYYGTAYVNGNVDISGPTDQLVIKAEVTSEEGTIFKIPLNDTNTFENSYIHFLSPEEKEAKISGEELVIENIKGLEMDFDLSVNENAEIEIVIDKASGSTIRGRGNGGLLAQINTNGKFNMYGDFIVSEGVYNFVYRKIIQKKFEVLSGGTLVWEGDPLKAEINIKALHEGISANPSVLLDNPINQSIPVEVEVHLTSQLEKPDVNFDVRFPNVNTTLNTELK
ncbi:MAG: translocation/assembly module TamB, partial [Bacteroidia bacterium]|nr:translocation/assembly module TamB [Bacteroidia bacterium]